MTIVFYQKDATIYAVQYQASENPLDVSKLEWLFSGAHKIKGDAVQGYFIGPRREMITPWSTMPLRLPRIWGLAVFCGLRNLPGQFAINLFSTRCCRRCTMDLTNTFIP